MAICIFIGKKGHPGVFPKAPIQKLNVCSSGGGGERQWLPHHPVTQWQLSCFRLHGPQGRPGAVEIEESVPGCTSRLVRKWFGHSPHWNTAPLTLGPISLKTKRKLMKSFHCYCRTLSPATLPRDE